MQTQPVLRMVCFFCVLANIFIFEAAADSHKISLRVGYVPLISHLPIVAADSKKKLKYENVTVSISEYNSITAIEAALRVGGADAALVPLPIALSLSADEIDIKILGSISRGGSMLISKIPGDYGSLKGKVIGVPGLDSSENIILKDVLDKQGLRYGLDYKVISIPLMSVLDDLSNGHVDAIYYPEPFCTIALAKGYGSVILGQEEDLYDILPMVLVIKDAFLRSDNMTAVTEWLESLIEACEALNSYPHSEIIEYAPYFPYSPEIINFSIKHKAGGTLFKPAPPDSDEIRFYLEKIIQLKILYKSIAIENLIEHEPMKGLLKKSAVEG